MVLGGGARGVRRERAQLHGCRVRKPSAGVRREPFLETMDATIPWASGARVDPAALRRRCPGQAGPQAPSLRRRCCGCICCRRGSRCPVSGSERRHLRLVCDAPAHGRSWWASPSEQVPRCHGARCTAGACWRSTGSRERLIASQKRGSSSRARARITRGRLDRGRHDRRRTDSTKTAAGQRRSRDVAGTEEGLTSAYSAEAHPGLWQARGRHVVRHRRPPMTWTRWRVWCVTVTRSRAPTPAANGANKRDVTERPHLSTEHRQVAAP